MISDYNLKAVVFDDREEEAKPLIDALNYERVPNIFINFKDDSRDDKKLQNIRIVFADLIIGDSYEGEKSLDAIRATILDNIDINNGPFILVCWSKHSEHSKILEQRLLDIEPKLNFITIALDKHRYFTKIDQTGIYELKKGVSFNNISIDIVSKLKELEYLEIFLEWEKDARNSISKILNNFLDNITNAIKVKDSISGTIKKTIGKQEELTNEQKLEAFYRTLNETLSDSIENNVAPVNKHDSFLSSLDLENLDEDIKAEINSKTLFEDILDGDKTFKNGNIYSFEEFKEKFSDQVLSEVCGYDEEDIFNKEFFKHDVISELKEKDGEKETVVDRVCRTLKSAIKGDKLLGKSAFGKECKQHTKNNYKPILMEFTPSCDIANNKYLKSRLIYGYLIDSTYKCFKNSSESLYITPFHFKLHNDNFGLNSNYRLVFFIKNIFAVNPNKIKEMTPIVRARKELVTDLQHDIANHISRIGISSIDSKWN